MFKNVFQIAYVTNDLERAVSLFQEEQGVAEIATFEDFTLVTPDGGNAVINVGLAYVGDVQLEIIEPVEGAVDLYRSWLPEGFAVRHHHFCSLLDSVDELQQVRADYVARGYTIALDASLGGSQIFYADTTALLDHYQEYAWVDEDSIAFMATLPRN